MSHFEGPLLISKVLPGPILEDMTFWESQISTYQQSVGGGGNSKKEKSPDPNLPDNKPPKPENSLIARLYSMRKWLHDLTSSSTSPTGNKLIKHHDYYRRFDILFSPKKELKDQKTDKQVKSNIQD